MENVLCEQSIFYSSNRLVEWIRASGMGILYRILLTYFAFGLICQRPANKREAI